MSLIWREHEKRLGKHVEPIRHDTNGTRFFVTSAQVQGSRLAKKVGESLSHFVRNQRLIWLGMGGTFHRNMHPRNKKIRQDLQSYQSRPDA